MFINYYFSPLLTLNTIEAAANAAAVSPARSEPGKKIVLIASYYIIMIIKS